MKVVINDNVAVLAPSSSSAAAAASDIVKVVRLFPLAVPVAMLVAETWPIVCVAVHAIS